MADLLGLRIIVEQPEEHHQGPRLVPLISFSRGSVAPSRNTSSISSMRGTTPPLAVAPWSRGAWSGPAVKEEEFELTGGVLPGGTYAAERVAAYRTG
ncbi:hypothetical protein ACIPYQ_38350 [Streptomyces sp. NPDC090045]|uniref:hypothetical protein n=1 Tax=Streptomyces sp. NPDC090045 TaxID=3365927 RepID=UPI003828C584